MQLPFRDERPSHFSGMGVSPMHSNPTSIGETPMPLINHERPGRGNQTLHLKRASRMVCCGKLIQDGQHLLKVHGFGEVCDEARFFSAEDIVFGAVSADRDAAQAEGLLELAHEIQAAAVGEPKVAEDEIDDDRVVNRCRCVNILSDHGGIIFKAMSDAIAL